MSYIRCDKYHRETVLMEKLVGVPRPPGQRRTEPRWPTCLNSAPGGQERECSFNTWRIDFYTVHTKVPFGNWRGKKLFDLCLQEKNPNWQADTHTHTHITYIYNAWYIIRVKSPIHPTTNKHESSRQDFLLEGNLKKEVCSNTGSPPESLATRPSERAWQHHRRRSAPSN